MHRLALGILVCAACSSANTPSTPVDGSVPTPDSSVSPPATDVTRRAADSICSALFRCCDDNLDEYFAPYRGNDLLAQFKDRLPPDATLDEASCKTVLAEMLDVVPLGDWTRRVAAGDVTFDPAAFDACIATLDHAACGEPIRAALWDSTCLGFAPPSGGPAQRSFFHRTLGAGATCKPIRDGIGAAFYGTCNPTTSFCCYEVPGRDGCQFPYDGDGNGRTGTCQAIAGTGQSCSPSAPVKLCATGNDCDTDTLKCVAPVDAPLAVGAACIDAGYHALGTCQASYCDVLGTKKCEPMQPVGHDCSADEQCESGRCQTKCVEMDVCTGSPPPRPPSMPDGETCTNARDLIAASSASTTAGYTHLIAAPFGAADDYNPYKSSGLPPACSVVYDAKGHDVVYQVTLEPGDVLRMRLELDDGKQAGLYVLNSCPAATWWDSDMTGACGSNEYNVGFCNVVGCDPATLTLTHPATATAPATFWVVADQVGGTTSTGFHLDWRLD
jgi:hypothetical protein